MISRKETLHDPDFIKAANSDRRDFFPKVDSEFQWRYAFALALAVGVTLCVFMTPFLYLLHENFDIFHALALAKQPDLVEHLEREIFWITALGVGGMVLAVGFAMIFGFKLTGSILGPLFALERHMRKVSKGNWESEDFRIRSSDEFKRLANTYSFLYRNLRTDLSEDIEKLKWIEQLAQTPRNNEEIRKLLTDLIAAKNKKLGITSESRELPAEKTAVVFPLEAKKAS